MYVLNHFLHGKNIDHEFVDVGLTQGSINALSKTNWITEDTILDALCHHGDVAIQATQDDREFVIKDNESGFCACCSMGKHRRNRGYFCKVYYIGQKVVSDNKYTINI